MADRIIQLGGPSAMHPTQLSERAGCGYEEPPKDPIDLKRVIQDVLDAEACAIGYYSRMCEKYRTTDVATHEIFEDLLKDAVDDEEEWEKFLTKPVNFDDLETAVLTSKSQH